MSSSYATGEGNEECEGEEEATEQEASDVKLCGGGTRCSVRMPANHSGRRVIAVPYRDLLPFIDLRATLFANK